VYDRVRPVHIPGSRITFTEVQLFDLFSVPDWFPDARSPLPEIIVHGRAPDVYACGYCHTPHGQGRPENASLAGLPAAYIIQQVADFKSGLRRSASPVPYGPADRMIHAAKFVTAEEMSTAADYFSRQAFHSHVRIVESERVPRSQVVGQVYATLAGGGDEPLGERLMEFTPDGSRHEHRDEHLQYLTYVPLGSIKRGRAAAQHGANGLTIACITCHGNKLQGVGMIPRIGGRSPTYLLRALLAFQTGVRAGATGQPMLAVVEKLKLADMIDVAAYVASLEP
jgi:cytochrome c553